MTVRVDPMCVWPTQLRIFKGGSSHLTADSETELHAFAKRLGLKREWYQPHPVMSHYDLTPNKYALALTLGAELMSMREQIRMKRVHR